MTTYDGLDASALAGRWRLPRCDVYDRVSSTLDALHALAEEGAPAGTTVLADEQLAGRGRQGRHWYSPRGRGIWLGYLLRPESPGAVPLVSLRAGLATAVALDGLGAAVALKWPNDLVLADRKLGGILCEARWRGPHPAWVAVGVGLNVHGPMPDGLRQSAIALDEACSGTTRIDVLDRVIPSLGGLPIAPRLDGAELRAYAKRDWLRGRRILEPAAGLAVGLDEGGALLVEVAGGNVERVRGGSIVAA